MKAEQDFEQFVELLNKHDIRYLIVGAYAVGFHSLPRNTGDLDLWLEPTPENAEKLLKVLEEFGIGSLEIKAEDLMELERVIQIGFPPVRIDMLTSLTGLNFSEAHKKRVQGVLGSVSGYFISLEDLITNKDATGRTIDKADSEILKKFLPDNES